MCVFVQTNIRKKQAIDYQHDDTARLNFVYHEGTYTVYFTQVSNTIINMISDKVTIDYDTMYNFIKFTQHKDMYFYTQGNIIYLSLLKYINSTWTNIVNNSFNII
jgi:hypothetical protein